MSLHECGPLCPEHGDIRDTSLAQVIPFPLKETPAPKTPVCAVTVTVLIPTGDQVRAAELVSDALVMAGVLYSGEIEVSQA